MENRWVNNGNSKRLILGSSKTTADGDCSHGIKRHLLLGRRTMTNLDIILKSRHYQQRSVWSKLWFFQLSCMVVILDYKESLAPKNWYFWTVVSEKTLESSFDCKEIQPVNPKGNQSWIFIGRTDAEAKTPIQYLAIWWKEPTDWKRPWYWARLKAGGEGDARGWNGWMASLTRWIWVWASSGSWWRTGNPGVLQSMGSQKVGHGWATELNWWKHKWIEV